MPETVPTPDEPKTEATPDTADLERQARLAAETRAAYAEGRAIAAEEVLRSARPEPPQEDLLERVVGADITVTPEERKRALDTYLSKQRQEIEARNQQALEDRIRAERQMVGFDMAINSVLSRRPELNDPRNGPNFQAAMTKAKAEADQRGERLTPLQLMQKAEGVYDSLFGTKPAPSVPYVEGGSRPDLSPGMQAPTAEPSRSALEKMYGMDAGQIGAIPSPDDPEWDKMTADYIKSKNQPLMKRGIHSNIKNIRFYKEGE